MEIKLGSFVKTSQGLVGRVNRVIELGSHTRYYALTEFTRAYGTLVQTGGRPIVPASQIVAVAQMQAAGISAEAETPAA